MKMATTGEIFVQIRKLRKKIRQIENLENSDRDLTPDEVQKVNIFSVLGAARFTLYTPVKV